jgi:hypothetical protein
VEDEGSMEIMTDAIMGDMEDIRHPLEARADMVDHQHLIRLILEPVEPQIIIEMREVHHLTGKMQHVVKSTKPLAKIFSF